MGIGSYPQAALCQTRGFCNGKEISKGQRGILESGQKNLQDSCYVKGLLPRTHKKCQKS